MHTVTQRKRTFDGFGLVRINSSEIKYICAKSTYFSLRFVCGGLPVNVHEREGRVYKHSAV